MDCKDGSDEFNCVFPTTVSTTTILNSTQASSGTTITTTTTIVPTMAASSLVNETLLLPNVEALISDAASETYGGYETPLQNNNDRSDNLNSSIVKQYTPAGVVEHNSDNIPIENHNQNYTTGSVVPIELEDINRLLGMQQQLQQQQQLSTSSVAPVVELMASSSAVSSSINSGSSGVKGNSGSSKGDSASIGVARDEDNSSQQNIAKTVSNDAKTSYVVDDTKQLSDIQINALQPQDKAQLSQPNHHQQIVSLPREQQTQKQLASISTKYNNQANHQQPEVTPSYAPSIIINNKIKQQANEAAASIDSSSSAQPQSTPLTSNSNNLPATDSQTHDDNNQQQSLNSMNNQHHAHQQRLQFQQRHPLQQQQQQNLPNSQHMHLQQARRLFSSFNKYTSQTQQSRAPKLHHNKVPIYRSWINSLTGNHFHSQQNPLTNSNIQASLDTGAQMTSFRQKRDRLMAATQMPPSTVSAMQAFSTSVSPSMQPSSVGLPADGSSPITSSTPSIPPFSTQGPRGASSYFQLLSRYNLAGHRSPKSIPLIDYHQPQSQSVISRRNRPVKNNGEYFQRNGLPGETLVN